MKSTRSGHTWAHVICALWIPEIAFADPVRMEPITKASYVSWYSGIMRMLVVLAKRINPQKLLRCIGLCSRFLAHFFSII